MRFVKNLLLVVFGSISSLSHSSVITIGHLTLENVTDIYVTDHINQVDYLRWDIVKSLDYKALTLELGSGGAFEGWSIARNKEANDFVNALLPSRSSCDSLVLDSSCTRNTALNIEHFNQLMGMSSDATPNSSFAFFVSDNTVGSELGLLKASMSVSPLGDFNKTNEWNSFSRSDRFSSTGRNSDRPIGFQLWRTSVPVPEPSTLAIFALGICGLVLRHIKK